MILKTKTKAEFLERGKCYAPWYRDTETYLEEQGGMPLLRFQAGQEQEWMQLAFSTRLGGVSRGHLFSLNLGWERGESRENVCENYRRVCEALGADYRRLVFTDQVHETTVLYAGEELCAGENLEKRVSGVDGIYTDIPGLVLATSYADCVPLFFWDPVHRLIAASHSGWRGSVSKIGQRTLEKLQQRGSALQDIHVLIGPSICQDCYEVSRDVAEQFYHAYPVQEHGQILAEGRVTEEGEQKYQLDLWAANWCQLKRAGVSPENIHLSGVCTCCNHELLFSHRATGGRRGNLNGFIGIL